MMNKNRQPDAFQPPQKSIISQACIDLLHSYKERFLIPFLRRESGFEEARDNSDLSNDVKASGSDDLKKPFDVILWIVFSLSSSSADEDYSGTLSDEPHFDLIHSVKGRIPTSSRHHLKIRKIAAVPTSDFVGTANAQSIMILQEEACIDFEELVIKSEIVESKRLMKLTSMSPDLGLRSDTQEAPLKISPPFVCWFVVENADDGNKPITSQVTLIEGTLSGYNGEPIGWHSSENEDSLDVALESSTYGESSEVFDSESRQKMIEAKAENQFGFLTPDLNSSEYGSPIRICLTDEGNSPEIEKERELSSELQNCPAVSNFGERHKKTSGDDFSQHHDYRHAEDPFLISKKVSRPETFYELDIGSDEKASSKYVYRQNQVTEVLHSNSLNLQATSQQSSPQNTHYSPSGDISYQVTTALAGKAASPKCEKNHNNPLSSVCHPVSVSSREEDVEKRIASLELIVISQQEAINTLRNEMESLKTFSDNRDSSFFLYKLSQEKVVENLHQQMRTQKTDFMNHIESAFKFHAKKLEQMGADFHHALHSKESCLGREIVELAEKISKIESCRFKKDISEITLAIKPEARRMSGTENPSLAQSSRPPAIETAPPSPLVVSSLNASNLANEGEEPPRTKESHKELSTTSRSGVSSNENSKVHLDATDDFTQKLAILDRHTCTGRNGSFLCDPPPAPFMSNANRSLLNVSAVKTPLRTVPGDIRQFPNHPVMMSTYQQSSGVTRGVLTPIRDTVVNAASTPPILHTVGSRRDYHRTKCMPSQGDYGQASVVVESSRNNPPSTRTHILSHVPTKSEKENTIGLANAPASTLSDMLSRLEAKHKVKVDF